MKEQTQSRVFNWDTMQYETIPVDMIQGETVPATQMNMMRSNLRGQNQLVDGTVSNDMGFYNSVRNRSRSPAEKRPERIRVQD